MADAWIEVRDDVLRVVLNRPEAMNAMSAEMTSLVHEALMDVIGKRNARAVHITGAGRGFCAGADLAGDGLVSVGGGIEGAMMAGVNRLILAVREVPVPVVVALNGPAAGAGCGLALSTDFVVASRSAKLLTAFSRIGAVLDGGLSWTLPQTLGRARATGMAMLGEQAIDAEKAKEWGLIWDVVDDEELEATSEALVRRLAAGPTVALGLIKRQIAQGQSSSVADALRFEAACQGEAFRTEDFVEGVTAFQQKRPADFRGR